jgi:hypothetical protein
MLAALAAAPEAGLTGMSAAFIVATAVTALVALGMMMLALHRRARLTIVKSGASLLVGLAVVAIAVVGVVAVSPSGAEAAPNQPPAVTTVDTPDQVTDLQLPTLGLDDEGFEG